ncbi:MAG: acyl-CoA thioesterase [Spirosomaceae bacterium]|jgi:acyl-CoA thioester hydrolase|nr:acyl-CoA thioesterase [Spirosomataceae bacterium]
MLFIQDLIKDYPAYIELPVQWGDMDAMQHVNNVAYLRYLESGRIRFFADALKINALPTETGWILAEVNCRYKFPLTYPDTIIVATRVMPETLDEFSVKLQQIIVSTRHERVAAEGWSRLVFYDYAQTRKTAITEAVRARLRS